MLFIMDVTDWVCTLALLSTGYFTEANPLMQNVVGSVPLGFIVKVLVPGTLILFALKKLDGAGRKQLLISNNIILVGTAAYFLLILYHICCFGILFFYL